MNKTTWAVIAILLCSVGYNAYQRYQNDKLQHTVLLIDQKDKLQQQQMNDFIMTMYTRQNENTLELSRQNGKIEGMLAVITGQKPNEYEGNQLWHAGYYRGLDQSKDMKDIKSPTTEDTVKTGNKDK